MIRGHHLEAVVAANLAPSVRWLQEQIRDRKIRAHKIGRHWVMTDDDIADALRRWESGPPETPTTVAPLALTATSLRRRKAAS